MVSQGTCLVFLFCEWTEGSFTSSRIHILCGCFQVHRLQGMDEGSSSAFAWLPGTLWRWGGADVELELVRFLPDGHIQTPREQAGHWHQMEDGHGLAAVYLRGQRFEIHFGDSVQSGDEGIVSVDFKGRRVYPGGSVAGDVIYGTRCLTSPHSDSRFLRGWLMKRSGKLRLEWRVRWCELDIKAGLLKYFEFDSTPMHEAALMNQEVEP